MSNFFNLVLNIYNEAILNEQHKMYNSIKHHIKNAAQKCLTNLKIFNCDIENIYKTHFNDIKKMLVRDGFTITDEIDGVVIAWIA
jgi:virulence-associated protein VapD